MSKNYRSELVGAFGCPIDENPTGVMEEAAFAAAELDYRYLTIKVDKEDIETAMKAVRALHMRGINLTIPHKVSAIPYVDELSPEAQIIGAINIVVNNDGVLWGDNTDGKGFLKSLTDRDISVKGKTITVLGAGGASRAICVVCALQGASRLHIINGSVERGSELVALLTEKTPAKADLIRWENTSAVPDDTDILINATSVGLYPNVDQKPDIDYDTIKSGMVVCDVIFNDPNSLFLREAAKRGAVTVNGLGMLVNQGALNFKLWTGQEAPVDVMTETLQREFGL
ncbi:MAG: shikimate dehydrogenase [Lachnospiraceae bacterium]|nr:shikimate dehydrogenase [Lachnospiraceae bacterium]